MSDEQAERLPRLVAELLGHEGRMIALSKSSYSQRHPGRLPIFNANVVLSGAGKVWHGDFELSLDEPLLVELARRSGRTAYLLYEYDGRFDNALQPLLGRAVYRVSQSGETSYDHRFIVRDRAGRLRRRPPQRRELSHFALTVGWPRLWRFWLHERVTAEQARGAYRERSTLRYLGLRDHLDPRTYRRLSPLLVLGFFRGREQAGRWCTLEAIWYPTGKRHAPRALLNIRLAPPYGSLRPSLQLVIHPGRRYELRAGLDRQPAAVVGSDPTRSVGRVERLEPSSLRTRATVDLARDRMSSADNPERGEEDGQDLRAAGCHHAKLVRSRCPVASRPAHLRRRGTDASG